MNRKFWKGLLAVYGASTLFFTSCLPGEPSLPMDAADLAVMSLQAAYPGANLSLTGLRDETGGDAQEEPVLLKQEEEEAPEPVIFGEEPAVLIVHTHATETYLPASEGNYHSKARENSVRDVGEALAESLMEEGIAVIHDETLHDSPSYSNSYSRSRQTITALLDQYPTIRCVIDLHRDAIAGESAGAAVSIGGSLCAKYMYVLSTAVPTYENNRRFIAALSKSAEADYSGFTGSVLERGYQYNQDLSDHYLLLEIGNNRNHIEEARSTARIFGKILAKTLQAGY